MEITTEDGNAAGAQACHLEVNPGIITYTSLLDLLQYIFFQVSYWAHDDSNRFACLEQEGSMCKSLSRLHRHKYQQQHRWSSLAFRAQR